MISCRTDTKVSDPETASKPEDKAITAASDLSETEVENDNQEIDKVLIVYFSLTGNTRKIADTLKDLTDGEVFEIQTEFDYFINRSRSEMEQLGKEQVEQGYQPKLTNSVADIDSYDLIIVGSPVWWGAVTPPVMSFLAEYKLEGKKVAPFCSCVSVEGDFFTQLEEAIPDAEVLDGLKLTEDELKDDEAFKEKLEAWLDNIY